MHIFSRQTFCTFCSSVCSSAAYIQHNDDNADLHHTPLSCKWSKSVGCLFTCISVIIHHYSKSALTIIWCQIDLIFTSKGYHVLCKWSDNIVWCIIRLISFSALWSNLALSAVRSTEARIFMHKEKMKKSTHNCSSKCTSIMSFWIHEWNFKMNVIKLHILLYSKIIDLYLFYIYIHFSNLLQLETSGAHFLKLYFLTYLDLFIF